LAKIPPKNAMCHDLKPLKIDNENPLSIFETKISPKKFICHMSLCKLLIFMIIYRCHTIVYGW
jgi:hypothetical protein